MSVNRSWIDNRLYKGGVTNEFKQVIVEFLNFAYSKSELVRFGDKIACPCKKCCFRYFKLRKEVNLDLLKNGFVDGYYVWNKHGETKTPSAGEGSSMDCNWPRDMVVDAMGSTIEHGDRGEPIGETTTSSVGEGSSMTCNWPRDMIVDAMGSSTEHGDSDEPIGEARNIFKLLNDADEPLWNGCTKHTKLSAITLLLHAKTQYHISNEGFDHLITLFLEMMPEGAKLPNSTYHMKAVIKDLGMSQEKIHACPKDCVLFRGEYASLEKCPVCSHNRYKVYDKENKKRKPIPHKILWYFPLIPRLQRLFMSSKTAEHMRWHKEKRLDVDGELRHPADADEWKLFDKRYPAFSSDCRNVRLILASDGFNPFGVSSVSHSIWPVFVIPYNLPPGMCMKEAYMFMSLLIPGPKSPGKDIDVYLKPLIEELQLLWTEGVETYDAHKKQIFQMHAALLGTIADFPAYGMLSGWSTHGKMSCPCCMSPDLTFVLKNGRKPSYFGCHRRWLPRGNKWRMEHFASKFNGTVEKRTIPYRKSGATILSILNRLGPLSLGKEHKKDHFLGYGVEHHWTKKSVFFDLPYWSSLIIRHHLDVMHIEKNVFDNIFNTVMNVKDKTKDNPNARLDLMEMGIRPELHLQPHRGKSVMPKAIYCLSKDQQKQVYEWMNSLKVPDGFSANISRAVNLNEYKLQGLKTHDCHVLLERYLPLMFRDVLPKEVWEPLVELSNFFKCLCSRTCKKDDLDKLQRQVVYTLCKLEMIFPPSMFDSMEHLIVHLCDEAKFGGPVQYRWMFPLERDMFHLKQMVRNKARPEGSIAEAYLLEELTTFCSRYFDTSVRTKLTRPDRQFTGVIQNDSQNLSVFVQQGCGLGRYEDYWLTDEEYKAASLYVLLNCDEVLPYIREFQEYLIANTPNIPVEEFNKRINLEFVDWFKRRIETDATILSPKLRELAGKPIRRATTCKGYLINGYRFWGQLRDHNKTTQNHGVYVVGGSCGQTNETIYYGHLEDVYNIIYPGVECNNIVVLFKCEWYDPVKGVVVDKKSGIVDVNTSSRMKDVYDPFVFAHQAKQCFYAKQVGNKRKGWSMAINTIGRHYFEVPTQHQSLENDDIEVMQETYQEIDVVVPEHDAELQLQYLNDATAVGVEVDVNMEEYQSPQNVDHIIDSDDDCYEAIVCSDDSDEHEHDETD